MDVLEIEDDDGFVTTWPWPEGKTMLSSGEFVDLCVAQHEALRQQRDEFLAGLEGQS